MNGVQTSRDVSPMVELETISSGPCRLSSGEFSAIQQIVYRESGIFLSQTKRALVVSRLNRRLRDLRLATFSEYLDRVTGDPDERVQMLNCLCTNETHFFREPSHFEFIERTVAPLWRETAERGERARRIRVWSAGCSTGEEPYSLAMLLLDLFAGWEIDIVASDLSTKVLEQAVAAVWPLAKSSEIPPRFLRKYMLRGVGSEEGKMRAGPLIRSVVSFYQINLNTESYPLRGTFDLIFCRNVMIYFDADVRKRITERLISRLTGSGYFFVGHAESLTNVSVTVRCVVPTVYQHKVCS